MIIMKLLSSSSSSSSSSSTFASCLQVLPAMTFIVVVLFSSSSSSPSFRVMAADHTLSLSNDTVHWGYFSKDEPPVLTINSGDDVTVEMATHHACDDWDKMIKGDAGMESIYLWNENGKNEDKRGKSGGGDGVHILTGPIYVNDAEPGDILKVEILELAGRPNPDGKIYGSNAAAWWGFQARVNNVDGSPFLSGSFSSTPDTNHEFITIYEVEEIDGQSYVVPSYQFEWVNITDPQGVQRDFIQYPGTCVPHDDHGDTAISSDVSDHGWTKDSKITYYDDMFKAKIPINYHVGCMGLPPASHDFVDSIPPMVTGGNLDDKRIGAGTTMYYPVQVTGGLLSMGDAHAAQGDSELDGTGIETSVTGKFKISIIKADEFTKWQTKLDFPLGETESEYIVHGFTETDYLDTYADNPGDIYSNSDINKAMKNAYTQTRKFLMAAYDLTEMETVTLITQAVDFGMTQLVDGNWGVHAIIPKAVFGPTTSSSAGDGDKSIVDLACSDDQFTILCSLASTCSFSAENFYPITVFAPNDEAFKSLDEAMGGLENIDEQILCDILKFHVVSGETIHSDELRCGSGDSSLIGMMNGIDARVKCKKGIPYGIKGGGNDEPVAFIDIDIEASDGVIHVIDGVLFYPDMTTSRDGSDVVPSFREDIP